MNKTLSDLVTAVSALQSSVQALIAKEQGQIDPALVQPVIDQVNALSTSVQAAVNPPVPPVA